MIITKHSIKTKAKPETIWSLWKNVNEWFQWDHGIEASQLDGPFEAGSKGWVKTKGAPKLNFRLLEVVPLKKFHNRSSLPLANLDFVHTIESDGEYSTITHQVEMTGLLTFLFSKVIGNEVKKDMPFAMGKLVQIAEKSK